MRDHWIYKFTQLMLAILIYQSLFFILEHSGIRPPLWMSQWVAKITSGALPMNRQLVWAGLRDFLVIVVFYIIIDHILFVLRRNKEKAARQHRPSLRT